MSITKCISISREFEDLADKYRLSWSEAAKIGMGIMLADLGIKEYNSELNLHRKMTMIRQTLEETSKELEELKKRQDGSANTV